MAEVDGQWVAASLPWDQYTDAEVLDCIRGHWAAIENGTHHRRDVPLGEEACRVTQPHGAEALACLRNLANGCFELEKANKRTTVDTFKSCGQQQTFSTAWKTLNR